MKKFVFLALIVCLGLVLGLLFSKKTSLKTNTPPATKQEERIAPVITGVDQPQPQYQTTETYSFPESLAQYQVDTSLQLETVSKTLTGALGFSSSPSKIEGSKGVYFIWNEGGRSLIIGGNPAEVSYSSGAGSTKNLSSDTSTYKVAAQNFLNNFSSLFGDVHLNISSESYIVSSKEDPVVTEDPTKASVFLVNYYLLIGDRPVITSSANIEGASVGVDAENNILSFRSYVFPQFKADSKQVSLFSFSEAQNLLVSNRGVLLNFSYVGSKNQGESIAQANTPPQISTIKNVLLGYYFSPELKTLTPVYVFFGEGVDGQKNILSTITVVSANK